MKNYYIIGKSKTTGNESRFVLWNEDSGIAGSFGDVIDNVGTLISHSAFLQTYTTNGCIVEDDPEPM